MKFFIMLPVWASQFEESIKVVCRQLRLALAPTSGGATYFLIVAAVIAGHEHNLLRTLLAPLLATLGALLGIVDDDVEWSLNTTARGHLSIAWGRAKFDRLVAGGVLGGDAAQLLSDVPKNVTRCLIGRHFLCVAHAASGRLHIWPLVITAVSLSIAAFTLVWVLSAAFKMHAHIPEFGWVAPLPWQSLVQEISRWWWCHPCRRGLHGLFLPTSPSINWDRGRVSPAPAGAIHELHSSDCVDIY
jgi:hypothetical protein